MTKEVKTGAAPVSKYAAKKAARSAKANLEVVETTKVDDENVESPADKAEENHPTISPSTTTSDKKKEKKSNLPPTAGMYPEHIVAVALIIKNNAEIRRFTALGILNYLLQKGEIKGDKRYVSFKWNKFAVKANGLMREFSYNEPFFLNALIAAFASFSASAQRTIDAFCKKEMSVGITKAVDQEEVDNIAALNEEYQGEGDSVVED
jgi:hypothetical protein